MLILLRVLKVDLSESPFSRLLMCKDQPHAKKTYIPFAPAGVSDNHVTSSSFFSGPALGHTVILCENKGSALSVQVCVCVCVCVMGSKIELYL